MKSKFMNWMEILLVSTRLGLTSFGGPIAHLGYFHEEYVRKKKWIDEKTYSELVALCQFLPGPASSQVGIGIGILKGGKMGGIISFIGFTIPSVIVLTLFAIFLENTGVSDAGWLSGLKIVAVAVVAHAVLGMASKLTPDLTRKTIALLSLLVTLLWGSSFSQVTVIILAGACGFFLFRKDEDMAEQKNHSHFPISKTFGSVCLVLFFGLLGGLPLLKEATSTMAVTLFDSFYRAGALVFGGGHVVLPLLEKELVPTGIISGQEFLAGYGAAQAVPGPLFTFAAFLGGAIGGWEYALLATIAIFLPAFLLIFGALPFWNALRRNPGMNGVLMGVNASVVGILISAFYEPIWTSTITSPLHFGIAAILFSMLMFWKLPPWVIVVAGIIAGFLFL
ncbi:chromate efflux transporter [Rossellomorea sp. FS2]|uniref:chromate efflux transporter n=2 Tax=Bacillaceae TaxID=186817 RepID=UPI00064FC728|nr:chromate efflux transporter [Rossellomorea marisflavi]KML06597.1 ChrA protein [Rossellomorea marisflavi]USK94247.1 chromate efflux transporter [Rossellomorea marisflavi]